MPQRSKTSGSRSTARGPSAANSGSVVLIGFMGSGKTTVGRALAEHLGMKFVDTDEIVERRAGRSIQKIFDTSGEAKFRALEHMAIKQASRTGDRVIACGGGAILELRNHEILKEAGPVVYLRARVDTLRARLRTPAGRPLLRTRGALERLYSERSPAYLAAADVVVDVDDGTPDEIAQRVVEALL